MGAIGQTKAHLDTNHVDVWLNDQPVVKDSQAYLIDPQVVASHLHENQVNVKVDLHNGKALGQAWGVT